VPAIGYPTSTLARHRSAFAWWSALLMVVVLIVASGSKRTVVHNYLLAGTQWVHSGDLYNDDGSGFIYLPLFAAAFAPLSQVPVPIAESLWRIIAVSLFATGIYRLCRALECEGGIEVFLTTTIVAIPLSFSAAQNGQATLAMSGCMLHAVSSMTSHRFPRASVWLWVAVAIKPLAIVLLLLVAVVQPKCRQPLAIGALLMVLFPFLTQSPAYVAEQMAHVPEMLAAANHGGQAEYWAQLFGMLEVAGVSISAPSQTVLRIFAAFAALGLVAWGVRKTSGGHAAILVYAVAATYVMLFSPRSENNTYAMLAPAIGVFLALEADRFRRPALAVCLLLIAIGTLGSFEIGRLFTPREKSIWLAPLMAVGFGCYLLQHIWRLQTLAHDTSSSTSSTSTSPSDPCVTDPLETNPSTLQVQDGPSSRAA
jgi:hypothetical protein